jgi:DEAD/DEAH box helicase domain-containing protein
VGRHEPVLFDAFCRMLGESLSDDTRDTAGDLHHAAATDAGICAPASSPSSRRPWPSANPGASGARRSAPNSSGSRNAPRTNRPWNEIDLLEKERIGLGRRIQQLNDDYLLEALTNAGLLPNYAFPEEGVSLTTIIHGARTTGEDYVVPVHRYSRPAHAALAEFAPRNTFYAHKSKVEIDQIDLSVEPAADYRFCARCHHLTPLTEPDARADVCPRCADSHWLDGSQVRPVLRLRRAVANIRRTDRMRITETDEARNPKFYARRLLMNFAVEDVRHAWTLESSQAIYGFEFLTRAVFHDLNLGQPPIADSAEYATLIAGDDSAKAGFTLCKRCGLVQPGGNRGRDEPRASAHTPDCPERHATGTEHLLERLFLYREFESECLRILVPRGFGSGERTTYSFMSALQLGLRRRFGGKVDHLRFETMAETGAADDGGKTYILIYDSVPGGTGYLQQLLAGDADTLTEVLAAAHAVIRDCGCAVKPEQDGCYQCVFHYRQGRHRRHISRAVALEMLDALVEGEFERKPVKCLSEIEIDPSFGSELERRFLPALRQLGGQMDGERERFPPVQVTQDVKGCKTAYLLTVGPHRYWVDTQVPIEDPVSGRVLCQPDFVISKTQAAGAMRPIAVFVDGWEYHRRSLTEDARKRATLMLRGDYRVWSVTFEDIEAAHRLKGGTDLESPLSVLTTASGEGVKLPASWPPLAVEDLRANALALLVRLLGQPRSNDRDPLDALAWTARHLLIRSVRRPNEVTEAIQACAAAVLKALPDWLRHESQTVHLHSPSPLAGEGLGRGGIQSDTPNGSSNAGRSAVQWIGLADPRFLTGKSSASSYPIIGALVLDDPAIDADPKAGRLQWRQWLRLANLLQGLPGVALLTQSMLDARETLSSPAPRTETLIASDTGWSQVLAAGEFLERLAPGFTHLANAGVPAPDAIGIEHEDGDDYRQAEALWESARLVLLTTAQLECAEHWNQAGYRVIAEGESWWLAVEAVLSEQAK